MSTYDKKGPAAVLPPQQVFLHPIKRPWAEKYHTLLVGLADDGRLPRLEVDGGALQRQRLGDPHARAEEHLHERPEAEPLHIERARPFADRDRPDVPLDLLGRQECYFAL